MFRKKIPPPLQVEVPKKKEIVLPFSLVEQTRVMIDYLTRHEGIPEDQRNMLNEWLEEYSGVLAWYILSKYGMEGLFTATAEAQMVYNSFYDAAGSEYKEAESSLFEFLERDMNDGPDDPS